MLAIILKEPGLLSTLDNAATALMNDDWLDAPMDKFIQRIKDDAGLLHLASQLEKMCKHLPKHDRQSMKRAGALVWNWSEDEKRTWEPEENIPVALVREYWVNQLQVRGVSIVDFDKYNSGGPF